MRSDHDVVSEYAEGLYKRLEAERVVEPGLYEPGAENIEDILEAGKQHLDSAHILKENDPSRALGQENSFTVETALGMYIGSYEEMRQGLENLSRAPDVDEEQFERTKNVANSAIELSQDIVNDTQYSAKVREVHRYANERRSDS
jgi:hypothetical protein